MTDRSAHAEPHQDEDAALLPVYMMSRPAAEAG
jgi:hypothetical protein